MKYCSFEDIPEAITFPYSRLYAIFAIDYIQQCFDNHFTIAVTEIKNSSSIMIVQFSLLIL